MGLLSPLLSSEDAGAYDVVAAGEYITPPTSTNTSTRSNGTLHMTPLTLASAITIDRIAIEVTGAGTAGSVCRLGLYSDDGGKPGALLVDAGTVDTTTTGVKEVTVSQVLSAGRVWLAAVQQGAPATLATVRTTLSSLWIGNSSASNVLGTPGNGLLVTGVTGALPSPFPAGSSLSTQGHRIAVRRQA